MPRVKAVKQRKAFATTAPSYVSIPVNKGRRPKRGALSVLRRMSPLLLVLSIPLAAILTFTLSLTVRDWALGALGYGLIPVALWVASVAFALSYNKIWLKRFWRVWLASAVVVAISLGIMSMFNTLGGVMKDASLGGNWGQYLGGSPIVLGALKVAVLISLVPLILFPRQASITYRRGAEGLFRALVLTSKWVAAHLTLFLRYMRALAVRRFSKHHVEREGASLAQEVSESPKKRWRSASKVANATPALDYTALQEYPEADSAPGEIQKDSGGQKAGGWHLPSLELLSKGESRPISQTDLQAMARHIEDTLADHRVEVAVENIRTGPRVIRFGLVPGWMKKYRESKEAKSGASDIPPMEISRVKVQSILVREKDLALALKTAHLRLEAPVPGESLIGLEVPNPYPRTVALRTVAESAHFQKIATAGGLPVPLGEDTGGAPVVADLTELPHLLIAGATGSGKSVCINAIIAALLLTNRPDRLRMLMVDPKRVELTPFNGVPHLVAPVIVDVDEVMATLRGVQNEMLRRYKLLEQSGVRNIVGYNKKAAHHLPYLVVIIDELADLMMTAAYEVEQGLVRLAQLGRATGIHLILSTQRPSVNVVTGLLKANIPARVAFAVASQVDSRVILDSVGAEKLLSKGDMLLLTSDSPKPQRVQSTFVHDREIEKLVEFWKKQSGPPLQEVPLDERAASDHGEEYNDEDDLVDRARELAKKYQKLSPSVLQRRLQIGYPRAKQLIDLLQYEGLLHGPAEVKTKSFGELATPEPVHQYDGVIPSRVEAKAKPASKPAPPEPVHQYEGVIPGRVEAKAKPASKPAPPEPVHQYEEAIELAPGSRCLAYADRALAYTLLGRDAEAQQDADRAVNLGFDPATLEKTIDELKKRRSPDS